MKSYDYTPLFKYQLLTLVNFFRSLTAHYLRDGKSKWGASGTEQPFLSTRGIWRVYLADALSSLPGSSWGKYGMSTSVKDLWLYLEWIPKELVGPNPAWADSGQ